MFTARPHFCPPLPVVSEATGDWRLRPLAPLDGPFRPVCGLSTVSLTS